MPIFNEDLEQDQGMPESTQQLKKLMLEHDGLLIASPEYNSAFTPLLKMQSIGFRVLKQRMRHL